MEERLDDLIATAAPPVPGTAGRDDLLGQIIAETQLTAAARRFRTGRRWCLVASTLIVTVGAGVGVAAVSHLSLPAARTVDSSGQDALRVQVPIASDRMCDVVFMATSTSGGKAESLSHVSALTAARTFLRNADPAVFFAAGGDSTPSDDAAEETAVLPNSAAARIGIARREIQAVVRDYVVGRGLRADDIHVVSSAECRAANH